MFRTFNMGIGLVCVVPKTKLRKAEMLLAKLEEPCFRIGEVTKSDRSVTYQAAEPPQTMSQPEKRPARKKS